VKKRGKKKWEVELKSENKMKKKKLEIKIGHTVCFLRRWSFAMKSATVVLIFASSSGYSCTNMISKRWNARYPSRDFIEVMVSPARIETTLRSQNDEG
jgi:hypothetical protein